MNRRQFLQSVLPVSALGGTLSLRELNRAAGFLSSTEEFPMLFLGHGSPMNAIEENEFVEGFRKISERLPAPRAILCISAHWETAGTFVTAMPHPRTIHDFSGFPQELYNVQYPAPGSPELAEDVQKLVTSRHIAQDHHWGLDHGAWSVIRHLYPQAQIPVIQMSLDHRMSPEQHFNLAGELRVLRRKGVLIIGSGNMVHNLRMLAWDKFNEKNYAYDWAEEASTFFKDSILNKRFRDLVEYKGKSRAVNLAVPTPEHFLPLIYTLGLASEKENTELFNDAYVAGALTMTSLKFG